MAEIIEKINGLEDGGGVIAFSPHVDEQNPTGEYSAEVIFKKGAAKVTPLGAVADLKALATELSSLRAEVVLFAERIKREVGMGCPDPWRTVLIDRIDAEAQAFTALQQQEDHDDAKV